MRKWLFLLIAMLLLLLPIVGGCGEKEQLPKEFSLTVAVIGEGTTVPTPGTYTYNKGDWVTVTAVPDDGWKFDQWSSDASGSSVTTAIHMDGDKNVIATFSLSGES